MQLESHVITCIYEVCNIHAYVLNMLNCLCPLDLECFNFVSRVPKMMNFFIIFIINICCCSRKAYSLWCSH
ncbi:hypothetical protein ACHAW6_008876, partial [Cyclotella cf. meneghiniana]